MPIGAMRPDNQVEANLDGVSTKIVKTLHYDSSGNNWYDWFFDWYEHTDKN